MVKKTKGADWEGAWYYRKDSKDWRHSIYGYTVKAPSNVSSDYLYNVVLRKMQRKSEMDYEKRKKNTYGKD